MRKLNFILLAVVTISLLAAPLVRAFAEDGVLYQISASNALSTGLYDGYVSCAQIKENGDFGIAVGEGLNGELILLDGTFYQELADGTVRVAPDSLMVPFGMATRFKPTEQFDLGPIKNYPELRAEFDKHITSRNIIYAVRIEGNFPWIKNRSFPKQSKPYRKQAVIVDEQKIFEVKDTEGTLVGFWFPDYIYAVNLPGLHLHYLSRDHRSGGHTLDLATSRAKVSLQPIYQYLIVLPKSGEFLKTDLTGDKTQEIKKIQGR
jgi:acetolactate decarboxylase